MLSLGDTVATFAAMAAKHTGFDPARFPFAIGLSSQIVGNVQDGVLRAESVVTHPGRTLVIVETRVTSDAGKLLDPHHDHSSHPRRPGRMQDADLP
jgi:acyl-coenzyme A thioesterase PaaI-like protein